MKVTTQRALELNQFLDLADQYGAFTSKISSKFLANTFELSDIVEKHGAYVGKIREAWLKDQKLDKNAFVIEGEEGPEDNKELIAKFEQYLEANEEYQAYLLKENVVRFTQFDLKELTGSKYKTSIIKNLRPEILILDRKAKASAK